MPDADSYFAEAANRLRRNDLEGAIQGFALAAKAGRRDAAVIHCNLVASSGEWQKGLALLRALAPSGRRSQQELAILEQMAVAANGDHITVPVGETIGTSPDLTWFPAFFTRAECDYLIEAATAMLEPSVVVDNRTGRQVADPVRTSDGVGFTLPLENLAVHALNRRIAAASGTKVDQGEPLQVLRYRPGQEYKPHFDAIPGFANQRRLTMLIWLNDGYEGGETLFMADGRKLKGTAGDALLFRNADESGRRDDKAAHAGLPVTSGEKLIASRWIRQRRFEPPTVPGRAG